MQRVTFRRQVEALAVSRTGAARDFAICWRVIESALVCNDDNLTEAVTKSGIVVIDRNYLERILSNDAINSNVGITTRSLNQIRLLWSWDFGGRRDLHWCTEMSFDGIVYDIPSLRRWAAACLQKGFRSLVQSNSLLAGIELPSF